MSQLVDPESINTAKGIPHMYVTRKSEGARNYARSNLREIAMETKLFSHDDTDILLPKNIYSI